MSGSGEEEEVGCYHEEGNGREAGPGPESERVIQRPYVKKERGTRLHFAVSDGEALFELIYLVQTQSWNLLQMEPEGCAA